MFMELSALLCSTSVYRLCPFQLALMMKIRERQNIKDLELFGFWTSEHLNPHLQCKIMGLGVWWGSGTAIAIVSILWKYYLRDFRNPNTSQLISILWMPLMCQDMNQVIGKSHVKVLFRSNNLILSGVPESFYTWYFKLRFERWVKVSHIEEVRKKSIQAQEAIHTKALWQERAWDAEGTENK